MIEDFEYIFGYKNGMDPESLDSIWAEKAIDSLFEKMLTPEELERRRSIRLYRIAISRVVEEIISS